MYCLNGMDVHRNFFMKLMVSTGNNIHMYMHVLRAQVWLERDKFPFFSLYLEKQQQMTPTIKIRAPLNCKWDITRGVGGNFGMCYFWFCFVFFNNNFLSLDIWEAAFVYLAPVNFRKKTKKNVQRFLSSFRRPSDYFRVYNQIFILKLKTSC